MASIVATVGDAIVGAINGATLSQSVTATRADVKVTNLEDLATLTVTVIPQTLAVHARDLTPRHQYEWAFAIWIQQRTDGTTTQNDPLRQLHQEIIEVFKSWWQRPDYKLIAIEAPKAPDLPRLDDLGAFEAAILLTVRVNL